MEYLDSKVLESFIIEDNYIATEGIGSKLFSIIRQICTLIIKALTTVKNLLLGLLRKIRKPKTVNTSKELYDANKKLIKTYDLSYIILCFGPLKDAINIADMSLYLIAPGSASVEKRVSGNYNYYDEQFDECNKYLNNGILRINKMIDDVGNNNLHYTDYALSNIREWINKYTKDIDDTINKFHENLKKAETRNFHETSANDGDDESRQIEQQFKSKFIHAVTEASNYSVKFTSFLNTHISNEVLTYDAQLKYYDG